MNPWTPDLAEEVWYDDESGPVVRPYMVTGGRIRPDHDGLDLITVVRARPAGGTPVGLPPERAAIVRLCRQPMSVAEVAAHLRLPLGTVRVLLCDLRDAGVIAVPRASSGAGRTTEQLLSEVLAGLRTL
jgi:uncharacterized protein DUF742